jgi:hypothetical protein
LILEGEDRYFSVAITGIAPHEYNQTGLTMSELPNMVLGWALLLVPSHPARA